MPDILRCLAWLIVLRLTKPVVLENPPSPTDKPWYQDTLRLTDKIKYNVDSNKSKIFTGTSVESFNTFHQNGAEIIRV